MTEGGDSTPNLRKKRNFKELKLTPGASGTPAGPSKTTTTNAVDTIANNISKMALDTVDLQGADFEELCELGHGNGGTVKKVLHKPTNRIMARKVLYIDRGANKILEVEAENLKKRVVRELQILHTCHSQYIVSFYGAYIYEGEIFICMEFFDLGSLDYIYHKIGKLEEQVLGKITVDVLEGLIYLYHKHRIIHRDVKPNNILVNSSGEVKLCDFGVSGEAAESSVVDTFVGTSAYMSPERIQGRPYSVQSDVWSLGIALVELATGRFPFPPAAPGQEDTGEVQNITNLAVIELLEYIVNEQVPSLPPNTGFSKEFDEFITACLIKDPAKRPTPSQLSQHEFIQKSRASSLDMKAWAEDVRQKLGK